MARIWLTVISWLKFNFRDPDCMDTLESPAVHETWIPAIHAGMTAFFGLLRRKHPLERVYSGLHFFARSQAPAWECGLGSSSFQKHLKLELENNGFPSWSLGTSKVII